MSDLWRDGVMALEFWAWNCIYTIVPCRHIGLDQAPRPSGQRWDVPSLVGGTVALSVQSDAIGRVVVVDTGRATRRYISYCHCYYGDPAPVGTFLHPGDRVARLAGGNESPGSSWGGVHCHVVVHDKPRGAFEKGWGDTYYDPAEEIAAYNSGSPAGGGEEFTMSQFTEIMAALENIQKLIADTGPSLLDPNWRAGHGSVLYHLQNLAGFTYSGGESVADPEYLGSPGTIYNLLKTPVRRTDEAGNAVAIPQIQDNADTNTMVRQLLARPILTEEQMDTLGGVVQDAVKEAMGDAQGVDIDAIAEKTVDVFYRRLAS